MSEMRCLVRGALIAAAIGAAACKGATQPAPPIVNNTAPTIESIAMAGPRAEADRPIQVTAVVRDLESTLDRLTFTWSATPQTGAFGGTTTLAGNQATNTWRPPTGQPTPDLYTVTLTVTESFTSGGQPRANVVSSSTTVRYNDSPAEVLFLARDFLVSKFGNFNVGPAEAVSNFSDSCAGKAEELEDVQDNRAEVRILSALFLNPVATFDNTMTRGTVEGQCRFEDIPNSGPNAGKRQFVSGTCRLTTVYENFRWFLCDSNFISGTTELASLRGRVPGRIVFK